MKQIVFIFILFSFLPCNGQLLQNEFIYKTHTNAFLKESLSSTSAPKSVSWSNNQTRPVRTSIYFAPFALLHFAVGPSIRCGVEQCVGDFSLFTEYSHYIIKSKNFNDLKGYRIEGGLRYYLHNEDDRDMWISIGAGKIQQGFTKSGKLVNPMDSTSQNMIGNFTRNVQFIHFGAGNKTRFYDRFYIEYGLQVGLRHRALHVAGVSEKDEEWFYADTHSDESLTVSLRCWEGYTPDCSLIFRIGYDIISFK